MDRVIQPRSHDVTALRTSLIIATCTWLCIGCAAEPPGNNQTAPTSKQAGAGGADVSAVSENLRSAVIDDAARRSGKPRDAVKIIVAEAVTWSDGSLGCPDPSAMYTQALVRGYRIIARVEGQQYEYHAGSQGLPKFCPADRVMPPAPDDRI